MSRRRGKIGISLVRVLAALLVGITTSPSYAGKKQMPSCLGAVAGLAPTTQARQRRVQNPALAERALGQAGLRAVVDAQPAHTGDSTGDFYRVVTHPDGRISIFFGDAEGHGDKAAEATLRLHTHMDSALFAGALEGTPTASSVLEHLDTHLVFVDPAMTLGHVLYDPRTGRLEWASAAFPPIRILRADGRVEEITDGGGTYLGNTDLVPYRDVNDGTAFRDIGPGDSVVFVSDGVIDATARAGRSMNVVLGAELANQAGCAPRQIVNSILSGIDWTHDDRTILVFQRPR